MAKKQVFELSSKGLSQVEIARRLQIHESTISRDLDIIREQSKENIRKYIEERLPEEYEKCLVGLTAIQKEAWNTAGADRRRKGKDSSIVFGEGMLRNEIRITDQCHCCR